MIRTLVESVSHVDSLDMSWVRFKRTLESIHTTYRIQGGKAQTPEEEFDEAREGAEPKP